MYMQMFNKQCNSRKTYKGRMQCSEK